MLSHEMLLRILLFCLAVNYISYIPTFFLFGLVAVLVLYYGFHMDGLAWILKTAFAGVILFIALAIGATVYLIWYSTKKRKEKMAERDRKKAEKAGQAPVNEAKKAPLTREEAEAEAERREQESLRKIRGSRGQNTK